MSRFTYTLKNMFYTAQTNFAESGNRKISSITGILADVVDSAGKTLNRANLDETAQIAYLQSAVVSHIDFEQSMGNLTDDEKLTVTQFVSDFVEELKLLIA